MFPCVLNVFPACDKCNKTFASERDVKTHQIRVHPKKTFKCYHCNHVSKTKHHLIEHMKVHSNPRNRDIPCPMCSHCACNRKSMMRHYVEAHDVSLTPENYEFKDYKEFFSWKSDLQKKVRCRYGIRNGARKTFNKVTYWFRCFRDGFYRSIGKGKRRIKLGGSDKINGICPSAITASVDRQSGVVKVSYLASHVGHDMDVGRLKLSKDERDEIAWKIAAKVPFDVILREYKDSANCQLDPANMITRKDLWNIARALNPQNISGINPKDSVSVKSQMNLIKKSNIDSNHTKKKAAETADHSYHTKEKKAAETTDHLNSSINKERIAIYRIQAASRKDVHHDKHIKLNEAIMRRNEAENDDERVQLLQIIHLDASDDDTQDQQSAEENPQPMKIESSDLSPIHQNDASNNTNKQLQLQQLMHHDASNDDMRDQQSAEENPEQLKRESPDDKFRSLVATMLEMTKRHPGKLSSAVMRDAENLFQKMTAISDDLDAHNYCYQ